MMEYIKSFPSYKESQLLWLNKYPAHWKIQRGKHLFKCIDVRSENGEEELLTVSSERGIIPRKSATVTMFKAESYKGYKLCWPSDLVINSLWAWARGLGVSKHHGIVSSAYGVYRLLDSNNINPQFIHELVRSKPFQWELQVRSKGIWISRLQMTDESFLDAPFLIPPKENQTAIVRFLDYMDHRIKKYIRAKQKLIKLLEEQKQAIINDAVTGKIDVRTGKPYPKYKDSNIEWLGMVPEHWEVRRLKFLINGKLKYGANSAGVEYSKSLPRYIRITDFDSNGIFRSDTKLSLNADIAEDYLLNEGDILFARSGATVGKSFQCKGLKERSCFAGYLIKAVPNDSIITSDYLYLYAQSNVFLNWKNYSFIKATIENIGADKYSRLFVLLPSLDEQKMIELWKIKQTENLYLAIAHNERGIEIMREYRTRLIADVVTGKLDVRETTEKIADIAPVEDDLTNNLIEELGEEIIKNDDSPENQDVIKEEE
jgi:type I restriction enzyme S subunit